MYTILDAHTPLFFKLLVAASCISTICCRTYLTSEDDYNDIDPSKHTESLSSALSADAQDIEDRHDYDHHSANYKYAYSVSSPHSRDYKSQHEERIGDTVRGSYSLVEPDGRRRIVEYTADAEHGFNAVVRYEPASEQQLPRGPSPIAPHDDVDAPSTEHPRYFLRAHSLQPPVATVAPHAEQLSPTSTPPPSTFSSSTSTLEVEVRPRKAFFDLPQYLLHHMPYFRTHFPSTTAPPIAKYYVNPFPRLNGWHFLY